MTAPPLTEPSLPERVARTLRHEVGDLLQTVYATAAILQQRLPAGMDLERSIVADLHTRAELCKNLLDTVHDLVCPVTLSPEPVDLADLARVLVGQASHRRPKLQIVAETESLPRVQADLKRMEQMGRLLLDHACRSARSTVRFRAAPTSGGRGVSWAATDDGPGFPPDQVERLFIPFGITRPGSPGPGLALAQKLAALHGGRAWGENLPGGGFRVGVEMPLAPPSI
jgi:two-component system, OmpR family, sensor histidine kinase MtrB